MITCTCIPIISFICQDSGILYRARKPACMKGWLSETTFDFFEVIVNIATARSADWKMVSDHKIDGYSGKCW